MKLPFGIEIKFNKTEKQKNSLLRSLLPSWSYGRPLTNERDMTSLLNAFRSWVYIAASKNATSVAQSTLRLYYAKPSKDAKSRFITRKLTDKQVSYLYSGDQSHIQNLLSVRKAVEIEEIVEHPFLTILQTVNPFMNYFDLFEITSLYLELTGNAYWYLARSILGTPMEIWPVPSDRIRVVPDPEKFIAGYEYRYGNNVVNFKESDIVHFKFPNPKNLYVGMSPLSAVVASYNINESMDLYENKIFQNMGQLEGGFFTEESLDEEEFLRLKQEITDAWTGVKNAGKTPLFEKGVEYKNFGLKPRDLAFIEGREKVREILLNAFGQNLALYDKGATRANADTAYYHYAKHTIKPRCTRIEQKINEKLLPIWDDKIFCAFDDVVPEDQKLALQIRTENVKSGITSINEERKKLRMPPFEGCDEPFMQVQYAPVSQIIAGTTISGNQNQLPSQPPGENPKPEETPKPEEPKKEIPKEMIERIVDRLIPQIVNNIQLEG